MSSDDFAPLDLSFGWTIFGYCVFGGFLLSIPYSCHRGYQYLRLERANFIKKRHPRLTVIFVFCLQLMVLVRLIDCLLQYKYIPHNVSVQNILKCAQPCLVLPVTFTKVWLTYFDYRYTSIVTRSKWELMLILGCETDEVTKAEVLENRHWIIKYKRFLSSTSFIFILNNVPQLFIVILILFIFLATEKTEMQKYQIGVVIAGLNCFFFGGFALLLPLTKVSKLTDTISIRSEIMRIGGSFIAWLVCYFSITILASVVDYVADIASVLLFFCMFVIAWYCGTYTCFTVVLAKFAESIPTYHAIPTYDDHTDEDRDLFNFSNIKNKLISHSKSLSKLKPSMSNNNSSRDVSAHGRKVSRGLSQSRVNVNGTVSVSMSQVLSRWEGYQTFITFLCNEFSAENLLYISEVAQYRNSRVFGGTSKQPDKLKVTSNHIQMASISSLRRDISISATELSALPKSPTLESGQFKMPQLTTKVSPPPDLEESQNLQSPIMLDAKPADDGGSSGANTPTTRMSPGPPAHHQQQHSLQSQQSPLPRPRKGTTQPQRARLRYPTLPKEIPLSPIRTKKDMYEAIQRIGRRYIFDYSELQVNVSSRNRRLVIKRIERALRDYNAMNSKSTREAMDAQDAQDINKNNNNSDIDLYGTDPEANDTNDPNDTADATDGTEGNDGTDATPERDGNDGMDKLDGKLGKKRSSKLLKKQSKQTMTLDSSSGRNGVLQNVVVDFDDENENDEMNMEELQSMFDDCSFEILRLLRSSFRNFSDTREYQLYVSKLG